MPDMTLLKQCLDHAILDIVQQAPEVRTFHVAAGESRGIVIVGHHNPANARLAD